jgi:hypothetical protein
MTIIGASLTDEIQRDFFRARAQLAHARRHQADKDTPANRAAVAQWLAFIDAVLDMYLDTGHGTVAPVLHAHPRAGAKSSERPLSRTDIGVQRLRS